MLCRQWMLSLPQIIKFPFWLPLTPFPHSHSLLGVCLPLEGRGLHAFSSGSSAPCLPFQQTVNRAEMDLTSEWVQAWVGLWRRGLWRAVWKLVFLSHLLQTCHHQPSLGSIL